MSSNRRLRIAFREVAQPITPVFVQGEEFPFADWRLLLQLDGACKLPFFVNCGSAWAFANSDLTQAKFLWQ
jgi:hypothetical protein